jgi:hypothetical protein
VANRPWLNIATIEPLDFRCGHCGREVASNQGWQTQDGRLKTYVCPRCNKTSLWDHEEQRMVPGAPYGNEVAALPHELAVLYKEARDCVQANAYTSAVLGCRKILMHVAVEQGAAEGDSFMSYVEYLASNGYVPPHGKKWVDHIRKRGNEANHQITVMEQHDATELVSFTELLLKFVYELPSLVPEPTAQAAGSNGAE